MITVNSVIEVAKSQLGYLAKKNTNNLDDFTADPQTDVHSVKNNKFARDLYEARYYNTDKSYQGYDWCAIFADWVFWEASGRNNELSLATKPSGVGCNPLRNVFESKGMLYSTPQLGDQAFIRDADGGSLSHTGIVIAVTPTSVTTLDGNIKTKYNGVTYPSGVSTRTRSMGWYDSFGRPNYGNQLTIECTNNCANTTVSIPTKGSSGETIKLTITPNSGWLINNDIAVTVNGNSISLASIGRHYEGSFTLTENSSVIITGTTVVNNETIEVSVDNTNWVALADYKSVVPAYVDEGEYQFELYVRSKNGETVTDTFRSPYSIVQKIIKLQR